MKEAYWTKIRRQRSRLHRLLKWALEIISYDAKWIGID